MSINSRHELGIPKGTVWTVNCDASIVGGNSSDVGGYGFAIYSDGLLHHAKHGELCGYMLTNNLAELKAIQLALRHCFDHGCDTPIVYSDSEVAIKVLRGESTAKQPRFKLLADYIQQVLVPLFYRVEFRHVSRNHEMQRFADYLAKKGSVERTYRTLSEHLALINSFEEYHRD
jgi:ribonuclease HI